eukprot:421310_1
MAAVTQWYLDHIVTFTGLFIVAFICVVAMRKIKSHKFPMRLRVLLYGAHIFSVISFITGISVNIILLIFKLIAPTWNQHTICFVTYIFNTGAIATFLMCVINLFFERLCISFEETPFTVSKCTQYSFRIVVNGSWVIMGIVYLYYIDPLPYNIYSEQVDLHDGVTCSSHIQGTDPMITLTFELIAFLISGSNLLVWILFVDKLRALITMCKECSAKDVSKEFVCLMKEQTMLIGVAVFSSIILWSLQAIFQFGHFCAAIDIAVTTVVMFLTFRKLSADYFVMLKCEKCTACCCTVFEKYIVSRVSQELELSNAMPAQSVGSDSDMPSSIATTVVLESDKSIQIV